MDITFKPIGRVRTSAKEADARSNPENVEGRLEIYPEFEDALEGIDGYSHIFVLAYFHKLRPEQIGPLKVKKSWIPKKSFVY